VVDSSVVTFGNWLQHQSFALAVATSDWAYPFVQATHFTGLSLWVGTTVATDLSLMGMGNRYQSPLQLFNALFVWNWIGFCIAVLGGFLLFSAAAATYVINPAFLTKLGFLIPVALILHIVIQTKMREWGQQPTMPRVARIAGSIELLFWILVVTAAVSIPYFG
jgi:hypothetical protein